LKNRYTKIRALEDVDDISDQDNSHRGTITPRVRFLNYYTASTGIPKKPKIPPGHIMDQDGNLKPLDAEMNDLSLNEASNGWTTPTPRISIEDHSDDGARVYKVAESSEDSPIKAQMQNLGEASGVQEAEADEPPAMRHIDSIPIEEDEGESLATAITASIQSSEGLEPAILEVQKTPSEPALPPIPSVPDEPQPIDLSIYTDKDERKIAEKEQKRVMKVYQQAVKDRDNAIKDRRKLVEKREKRARQEQEKQLKEEHKQRLKEEKEEEKRNATINPPPPAAEEVKKQKPKPKRDRRFCLLPSDINGTRDSCWVRVYMEGVDEVGAHCGLFFQGPQYETLVGDVGARVEQWLKEDANRRAIREVEAGT